MPDNNGGLTRLTIEGYRQADFSGQPVATFTALFNPNTYNQKYEVVYHPRQGAGDTASPQVFSNIKPLDYNFELLFDGTGTAIERVDVADAIEDFLVVACRQDGEIHRPLYLKLSWGPLIVKCVLKSADITYTLFDADGSPLRARVRAAFAETVEDTRRVAEDRRNSPDLSHVHVVKAGEHLSLLADQYYNDPSRYLQVAQYNGLTNFRNLAPGQRLIFPPIQDEA